MNKPKTKQQLRRAFFALAIVGALLTLPQAQAQPIPATFNRYLTVNTSLVCKRPAETRLSPSKLLRCFHGTFEGTWVGTERDVIHPNGTVTLQASGVQRYS